MITKDIIILAVLIVIIGSALWYIIRKKKAGVRCIGCPENDNCKNGYCHCKKR